MSSLSQPNSDIGAGNTINSDDEKGRAGLPSANPTTSYWLREEELSPKLKGHRSTEELPSEADVVIVGSGITGAFAAHFLKNGVDEQEGKGFEGSVVMLEAREACSGATGRVSSLFFALCVAVFKLFILPLKHLIITRRMHVSVGGLTQAKTERRPLPTPNLHLDPRRRRL